MENLERALIFAAKAHENQYRKQTDIPYITHPVAVALILKQQGCSETLVIAGLLHDVVEDSDVTVGEVRHRFGDKIADIVAACTEPDKTTDWETRKKKMVRVYRNSSADVKWVACADKLHNLRCIRNDLVVLGDRVWKRFTRGKASQEWYYRTVSQALFTGLEEKKIQNSIFTQLAETIEDVFGKQ